MWHALRALLSTLNKARAIYFGDVQILVISTFSLMIAIKIEMEAQESK